MLLLRVTVVKQNVIQKVKSNVKRRHNAATTTMDGGRRRRSSSRNAHAYVFAIFGGVLFGYDLALISGILPTLKMKWMKNNDKVFLVSFVVAAAKIGAVFGAFFGAAAMRTFGRVKTASAFALGGSSVGALGCWWSARADSAFGFALGRMVLGIGIGALAVVVPQYVAEMAERTKRGRIGACYELSLCVGMVAANGATWWKPSETFGIVVLSPAVIGFWTAIVFSMQKESPRWEVSRGRAESARETLAATCRDEDEIEAELREYETEARECGMSRDHAGFGEALKNSFSGFGEAFDGDEKRAVRLVLALAALNQLCASTSVINYSAVILRAVAKASAVDDDSETTMDVYNAYAGIVVLCKTIGVVASIVLVDSVGRRPLLLYGASASGFGLVLASFGYSMSSLGWTLVGICAFILAFSASFASVFWVIVGEFFSMRLKSSAAAAVTATLFASGALADVAFPPMRAAMSFGVFIFFAVVCFASAAFVFSYIPETARRPLYEVQAILKAARAGYSAMPEDEDEDPEGHRMTDMTRVFPSSIATTP